MKTGESSLCASSPRPLSTLRSEIRRVMLLAQACCALALPVSAATVEATYNTAGDVPISSPFYTASGNTIQFTLNFAPQTGTSLTVIQNTGLNFIQGKFDNLAQGQMVTLSYGGINYYFTANYYGHSGRNLVLQWMNVKPFAWGSGTNGQLGNDDTISESQAVAVNQADVLWGKYPSSGSAGENHSLGLGADGTVASWGLNANGQLGNNSTTPSNVPVAVAISGVPSTRTVAAVAAGANHSLALCSDGKVVSWGLNTNGQLGNNSISQSIVPVNVDDTGVLSGKTVIAISAGTSHSLALCSDGTLVSWGLNTNGQLGNNSTAQSTVPVAINAYGALSGKIVVAIAAGASHSLALCHDGSVVSWGLNSSGQLGNNSTSQSNVPVAVNAAGVLFGKIVMMVSAGASHSLALCSDGTVASWGGNVSGQLGSGNNSPSYVPVEVINSGVLSGKFVAMISAGANHSIAHCTDGSVATWGEGNSGQLGNNNFSDSNNPVAAVTYSIGMGGYSGVISGPTANHTLAIVSSPEIEISNCGFNKWVSYSQSSTSDPILDPDTPYNFTSYVNSGTMGELLASSTLTLPAGATGAAVYEKGTSGLMLRQIFRSKSALDAAYPAGSYAMNIKTSTPNAHQVGLSIGGDNYPLVPKITSVTNATWVNGVLMVTNPANDTIINWSNSNSDGTLFQIENTNIRKNDFEPASSFTIPGNSLDQNSIVRADIQLMRGSGGAPIPGMPFSYASTSYHTQVRFLIQVGTPMLDDPMFLLLKSHSQVQASNSDPVDYPNNLPDNDLAPYSFTAESSVGGSLTGPSSTSFPLVFCPESDGVIFEYLSSGFNSVEDLNATYPNGVYTFPGAQSVNMPADSYPGTAKILTVNGATPVWNQEGQLALDPTIDNTIAWSAVNVPNFQVQGHQTVEFENYDDYNFESIEIERGPMGDELTPVTSITIPKSSMTPTCTYMGLIGYAYVPSPPSGNAIGAYETSNQFMAVALKPQTLSFGAIASKSYPSENFTLSASASSGLPVIYEVIDGPATVTGNTVTLVGAGTVIIRASQPGTGVYASAVSVTQSFEVTQATTVIVEFRSTYGLAADGSEDLLTPANDGVSNLLKYAFNMIGNGAGQVATLSIPNSQIVVIDGNAGLPKQEMSQGKLSLTYIRRRSSSNPGVIYAVEFSDTLTSGSWAVNGSAAESVTIIDNDFERVTVTDDSVMTKRFARVRVTVE